MGNLSSGCRCVRGGNRRQQGLHLVTQEFLGVIEDDTVPDRFVSAVVTAAVVSLRSVDSAISTPQEGMTSNIALHNA